MRTLLACLLLFSCTERSPQGSVRDATPTADGPLADAAISDGPSAHIDAASSCQGLDEATCYATAGCVADTCLPCSCTPTFVGCRAVGDTQTVCPSLRCAQPACCRTNSDCGSSTCAMTPPPGCGIPCNPNATSSCSSDAECKTQGSSYVCAGWTECCPEVLSCQQGCQSNAECVEPGQVCDAGRCVGITCGDAGGTCPPNSLCTDGTCQPTSCASDRDCDRPGYCVNGTCEDSLGTCYAPIP